jgi:pyrimidine deaminase RibD-like protein
MTEIDIKWMREAIDWAAGCNPIKESIPKVGAVIAIGDNVIGRGRRGTGRQGDDRHAEWDALSQVRDKAKLPEATLYTTLEPCTREVRSEELQCCTELIHQYKIPKVFVGILDPNQGVTGKGLWRLQDSGAEVDLFPHDLVQQIRALNAAFIRSQQTLGATIISPKNGDTLKTYETQGKYAVRFKCLNPPGTNTYLVSFRQGLCWPQSGSFRQVNESVWEIDLYFGSTGEYTLHLVTANDLGRALIEYYRKVVRLNIERREKVKKKIPEHLALLGGDYPGIQMNGLPKGFRSEASVALTIAEKP